MWPFSKKTPPARPGARRAALSAVPVKNREAVAERGQAGYWRIAYPVTVKPLFADVMRRFGMWNGRPLTKTLELDELGSRVWDLVDGRRSAGEVARELAEAYGLFPREAETAVAAFLRELGRRGLVAFRPPGEGGISRRE